jgi:antitoxin YefM
MKDVDGFIPITEAKNRLLDLIRDLQEKDDIVAITKHGVPAAVLLSIQRFEGLLETIDILSDEKVMTSLRRSLREARAGRWVSHEQVFGKGRRSTGHDTTPRLRVLSRSFIRRSRRPSEAGSGTS